MKSDLLVAHAPLMEESWTDVGTGFPGADWWSLPANLAPLVARPQLNQELEELVRFAVVEGVRLVAVGSGTGWLPWPPGDDARPTLLVSPGHTTVWNGISVEDRQTWMPAGETLCDAEEKLAREGYTLSLWPEDAGTLGGNWALPRGSFRSREFLAPQTRRLGVQACLANGTWFNSLDVPRSAAGPGIARGMAGFGGATGLITKVLVSITPLGERRTAIASAGEPGPWLTGIRSLAEREMFPESVSVVGGSGVWSLTWTQNCWNGWTERVWNEALDRLGLTETDAPPEPGRPSGGHVVTLSWEQLAERLGTANEGGVHLSGVGPEGMGWWTTSPEPAGSHWWRWFCATAGGVLGPVSEER